MLRVIAINALLMISIGCKPRVDISGTSGLGAENKSVPLNGNFYCETKIAKCEYGAGNVFDAGFKRGYSVTDFCNGSARVMLSAEPYLDEKICRSGMTRMELVCSCYPAREAQAEKDKNNAGYVGSNIPSCAEVSKRSYNWNQGTVAYGNGDGSSGICADIDAYGNVVACHEFTPGDVYYGRSVPCPAGQPQPQAIPVSPTRTPASSNTTVQPYSAPILPPTSPAPLKKPVKKPMVQF